LKLLCVIYAYGCIFEAVSELISKFSFDFNKYQQNVSIETNQFKKIKNSIDFHLITIHLHHKIKY